MALFKYSYDDYEMVQAVRILRQMNSSFPFENQHQFMSWLDQTLAHEVGDKLTYLSTYGFVATVFRVGGSILLHVKISISTGIVNQYLDSHVCTPLIIRPDNVPAVVWDSLTDEGKSWIIWHEQQHAQMQADLDVARKRGL